MSYLFSVLYACDLLPLYPWYSGFLGIAVPTFHPHGMHWSWIWSLSLLNNSQSTFTSSCCMALKFSFPQIMTLISKHPYLFPYLLWNFGFWPLPLLTITSPTDTSRTYLGTFPVIWSSTIPSLVRQFIHLQIYISLYHKTALSLCCLLAPRCPFCLMLPMLPSVLRTQCKLWQCQFGVSYFQY